MPSAGDSETIQFLNLSWNNFRRKGAKAIAEGLKVSSCMREELWRWSSTPILNHVCGVLANETWSFVGHANGIYLFILQSNNALRKLDLAYNGFADDGVGSLADALRVNSTLVELDVR